MTGKRKYRRNTFCSPTCVYRKCGYKDRTGAKMLIVDYFTTRSSANGAAKNEDEIEMKYALLGAGIGIFLVVSFVLIKIYMIKKHIYENELTDTPSKQSHSLREERKRIAQN